MPIPALSTASFTPLSSAVIALATAHVATILQHCFLHDDQQASLIVYDLRSDLASALAAAYRACLPHAQALDFDEHTPEQVQQSLSAMPVGALVVLIQSTNFRIDAYRIRVELFKRDLKVIEHPHLSRMPGSQAEIYIHSLAYDPDYYRPLGRGLKRLIDQADYAVVDSGGAELVFAGPLEDAKMNIGDYRDMKNWGGQFPIGEVFTEAKDLAAVRGRVRIEVFGDTTFSVNRPADPITLVIEQGQVVEVIDSTPEFDRVIAQIKADEGVVWVRELGFGLNPAFHAQNMVTDIFTY